MSDSTLYFDITPPEPPEDVETQLQRENTNWFIKADPIDIILTPMEKIDDGAGGYRSQPGEPRVVQTFRLIPSTDAMPQVQTPDGVQLTPTYVLLGAWDCVMERWDTFTLNGVDFRLVSPIRPDHKDPQFVFERKADVARS